MNITDDNKQIMVGKAYLRAACGCFIASHMTAMDACKLVITILANTYGAKWNVIAMRGRGLNPQTLN